VAPTLPIPLILVADASQAAKEAAKTTKDATVDASDQQVLGYLAALGTYHYGLATYA
jgi:hypothetical protein